jgi:hypothetical protein
MPRVSFPGFEIEVPTEWGEIETSESYDGPVLAGRDRAGSLLFQVTLAEPGGMSLGQLNADQLLDMLKTFGETRDWGAPRDVITESGALEIAAGSFTTDKDEFVRAWQVMEGEDYAFVFYTCKKDGPGEDLPLCEKVVRSIVFSIER